jgi:hypothetical protein
MRYVLLVYGSEDDAARMTGEERVAFLIRFPPLLPLQNE